MSNILQIKRPIVHDDDITGQEYHTYTPYSTSFNNNDEIRINIQAQDLYVLPSESYIHIEFTTAKRDGTPFAANEAIFTYNFISHLFSEMRYELKGVEIDRCKTPGITSLLKCAIATKSSDRATFRLYSLNSHRTLAAGTYRMVLPLRFVFGFCDDFEKIVLNSKHELILVRSRSDTNAYQALNEILNLTVTKIHWKVPHITLSDHAKLTMLKTIARNDTLTLPFRSWDLYELPVVPQTTRHSWNVKTTTQVTKPRYVVVAFQTNRNNVVVNDISTFDHCNISNVKLIMNNERFPYDDLNCNFEEISYHELYHMFAKIQKSYYNGTSTMNPLEIDFAGFLTRPVFAFDCSRTDERIKNGMVDVRIEIEARQNIPQNTSAYCLIIHDNIIRYSPFTSIVHREI